MSKPQHRFRAAPKNTIADQAKERDRQWFREHPDCTWMIRAQIPGEFQSPPPIEHSVYVYQQTPQLRYRVDITPQEKPLIESGQILMYPAVEDGVMRWRAVNVPKASDS